MNTRLMCVNCSSSHSNILYVDEAETLKELHVPFNPADNSINCRPIIVSPAAEINEEACPRRPAGQEEKLKVRWYLL